MTHLPGSRGCQFLGSSGPSVQVHLRLCGLSGCGAPSIRHTAISFHAFLSIVTGTRSTLGGSGGTAPEVRLPHCPPTGQMKFFVRVSGHLDENLVILLLWFYIKNCISVHYDWDFFSGDRPPLPLEDPAPLVCQSGGARTAPGILRTQNHCTKEWCPTSSRTERNWYHAAGALARARRCCTATRRHRVYNMKTWRNPQNRKYITYYDPSTAIRGNMHCRKFDEIRTSGSWDMLASRQTHR